MSDNVNHPKHYTSDPSGIECIQITRHRNFNIGNAIKYLWRAGLKDDASLDINSKTIEDLCKAMFYINDEIQPLQNETISNSMHPQEGEIYWFICDDLIVSDEVWSNDDIDRGRHEADNCFRTEEEAQLMADKLKQVLEGGNK